MSHTVFTFLWYYLTEDEQGKIYRKEEEKNILTMRWVLQTKVFMLL